MTMIQSGQEFLDALSAKKESNNTPKTEDKTKQAFTVFRIQSQYPKFIKQEAEKIANDVILKPLHQRMASFGYSQKIIDGTTIENITVNSTGTLTFDVVSDYDSESGFDVAKAREEGTIDHDLPKVPGRVYSWIAGGFIRAFSKGHRVKGITATNVVEKTVAEKIPEAQARLNDATDQFMQRSGAE